eukprot:scaffold2162_cov60-Phaeocystis_antarctica.AAC.2
MPKTTPRTLISPRDDASLSFQCNCEGSEKKARYYPRCPAVPPLPPLPPLHPAPPVPPAPPFHPMKP